MRGLAALSGAPSLTWYLVACANLRLGRAADAVAAIERAEAGDHLWRIGLLLALLDEQQAGGDQGTPTPAFASRAPMRCSKSAGKS